MGILIRLDVDKPFGRTTVLEKVKSKMREDYWLPRIPFGPYLQDLAELLDFANSNQFPMVLYHRLCTRPVASMVKQIEKGGHAFGLHAEDTRGPEGFRFEIEKLKQWYPDLPLHSFTKHGSGELRLGRRHYAPYEPDKYRTWGDDAGVPFLFGNGVAQGESDFTSIDGFFPNVFWLEPDYRSEKFNDLEAALELARKHHVIFSTHPENLRAIPAVKKAFMRIVEKGKQDKTPFITDAFH